MFFIAFVVAAVVGAVLGAGIPGALLVGIAGVVVAFVAQAAIGIAYTQRSRAAVPVDLAAPMPEPLSQEAYERLPLATRNAVVARSVAATTGSTPENVAGLLAEMMGRSPVSNLASQRGAQVLMEGINPAKVDRARVTAILQAELAMAARAAMPPTDRARAVAEANFGQAVTQEVMRDALLTTRFPLIGRRSTAEMMAAVIEGEMDLAFVVGLIRKTGEKHQRTLSKLGR